MPEKIGLLIKSSSVHTKGMLCSIDLIGLDGDGIVTYLQEAAAANSPPIKMPKKTKQILELPIGSIQALAVNLNDSVTIGDLT